MDRYLFNGDSYQKKIVSMLLNYLFLQEGRTLTAMALQKGLCTARASNDDELSSVLLLIKGTFCFFFTEEEEKRMDNRGRYFAKKFKNAQGVINSTLAKFPQFPKLSGSKV